jgi:hypothetical protein
VLPSDTMFLRHFRVLSMSAQHPTAAVSQLPCSMSTPGQKGDIKFAAVDVR